MNQFIESLKRLYASGQISEEKIINMCNKGTISEANKKYILENLRKE